MEETSTQSIITKSIAALVRHGLTSLAGILVGIGALSANQSTNFVEIGAGVAIFIASYVWSFMQKKTEVAKVEQLEEKIPVAMGGKMK
jgi:hypothetical protein